VTSYPTKSMSGSTGRADLLFPIKNLRGHRGTARKCTLRGYYGVMVTVRRRMKQTYWIFSAVGLRWHNNAGYELAKWLEDPLSG
jgi:hypothetical protein